MPPVYDESIEDAFPMLREMEQRREQLLAAAHRKRARLVERMAAAEDDEQENDSEDDENTDDEKQNTAPPQRVNMRRYKSRGVRRHVTLADLPKEDIFGRPIPAAPQKTFPSVGRRLGGDGEKSRSVWVSPFGDLDIEWIDILLVAFMTVVLTSIIVRIVHRMRATPHRNYSNENNRLDTEMAKLTSTLERVDRMLVANEQQTRMLTALTIMATRGAEAADANASSQSITSQ